MNLKQALAAAREVKDCRERAQALIRLLPHIAPPERKAVQREVLAAVRECAQNAYRSAPAEIVVPLEAQPAFNHMWAWHGIIAPLPKDLLVTILGMVEEIEDEVEKSWALSAMKDMFSAKQVKRAQRRLKKQQ